MWQIAERYFYEADGVKRTKYIILKMDTGHGSNFKHQPHLPFWCITLFTTHAFSWGWQDY
jgi:hypothetical protein